MIIYEYLIKLGDTIYGVCMHPGQFECIGRPNPATPDQTTINTIHMVKLTLLCIIALKNSQQKKTKI